MGAINKPALTELLGIEEPQKLSLIHIFWAIVCAAMGSSVAGWASIVCIVCFMSGVQLVCLGVIGEYIGKIYMETNISLSARKS